MTNDGRTTTMSSRICARAPDAERAALFVAAASVVIGVLGWLIIGAYALPLALLLGGALVFASLSPLPLDVGSDGLAFVGRPKTFISFSEVEAIEETERATLLRFARRAPLALVSAYGRPLDRATVGRLNGLVLLHWRESAAVLSLPARGEAPIAEWVEALRRSPAASDRTALLAAVEDPALSAMARGTAALLLRSRLGVDERVRVHAVAQTTVCAETRRAFDLSLAATTTESEVLAAIDALAKGSETRTSVARAIELRFEKAGYAFQRMLERVLAELTPKRAPRPKDADELTTLVRHFPKPL